MSTETIKLNAADRKTGKGASRGLRNEKRVPCIVYGHGVKNQNFSIDELSATRYSSQGYENALFELDYPENKELHGLSVLMKDISVHPVTRRPQHCDFFAVDMKSTVKVSVEVKYEGKAKGVAEDGGVLQVLLRNIEVECLPKDIPDSLTADISPLGLGEVLHISNLNLPNGVTSTAQEDLALVSVTSPASAEEEKPAEEAAADAAPEAEKKD